MAHLIALVTVEDGDNVFVTIQPTPILRHLFSQLPNLNPAVVDYSFHKTTEEFVNRVLTGLTRLKKAYDFGNKKFGRGISLPKEHARVLVENPLSLWDWEGDPIEKYLEKHFSDITGEMRKELYRFVENLWAVRMSSWEARDAACLWNLSNRLYNTANKEMNLGK